MSQAQLQERSSADATFDAFSTMIVASQLNEKLTFNRVINTALVFLFIAVIALQVTCIASMWHKHEEIKHEWDCTYEKCCPLFIDYQDEAQGESGNNSFCYFVVYGSGVSALCSLLMLILLPIRIVKYKRYAGTYCC